MFKDQPPPASDNITGSEQLSKNSTTNLFNDSWWSEAKPLRKNPPPIPQDSNLQIVLEQHPSALKGLESDRSKQAASDKQAHIERDDNPPIARGLATPCYKWEDKSAEPKGAVLLIHAFPAHGALYDNLARKLAAEGMVVYAPDLRGLGRAYSSGLAPQLDYVGSTDSDMAVLANRIRKENPGKPLIVGGESMGGAFSLRMAALHPELVDGLILSGAAIKNVPHYFGLIPQGIRNVIGPRHPQIDFSNQIRQFFSDDPRITADLLNDPLVRKRFDTSELTQCQRISRDTVGLVSAVRPNVPVLLLQSVDDMQTSARRSMRVYDNELRSNDFTPAIFPPYGHVLLETPYMHKDVEDTVLNWVRKKVPAKQGN